MGWVDCSTKKRISDSLRNLSTMSLGDKLSCIHCLNINLRLTQIDLTNVGRLQKVQVFDSLCITV